MSDALAASLAGEPPATTEAPAIAPAAPDAPAAPAAEPSRREIMREAIAKQKGEAEEGRNPNAPVARAAPAAPAADRARAPDGKFAAGTNAAAPAPAAAAAENPAAPEAQTDAAKVKWGAPPSWSPTAKMAFDAMHPAVKEAVFKREQEYAKGHAIVQERMAKLKPVEKYVEMAERSGTTLDKALERFTGMEDALRRDPFLGFEQIAQNANINLRAFAIAYLQRASQGGQNAGQNAPNTAHHPATLDPQAIIRQATEAVRAEYKQREVVGEIESFAADPKNRFYANVEPHLEKLLQSGLAGGATPRERLQNAYDMACRMDPEISRLINAPPPLDPRKLAADQARAAARATTGAPASGFTPARDGLPENATRRQIMQAAIDRQRGARA